MYQITIALKKTILKFHILMVKCLKNIKYAFFVKIGKVAIMMH